MSIQEEHPLTVINRIEAYKEKYKSILLKNEEVFRKTGKRRKAPMPDEKLLKRSRKLYTKMKEDNRKTLRRLEIALMADKDKNSKHMLKRDILLDIIKDFL